MGIQPEPIPEYGDDCLLCYAANKTPLAMHISFSGIERGSLWVPSDGMPPNQTFLIVQSITAPCSYYWNWDGWPHVWYITQSGASTVWCRNAQGVTAFHDTILNECEKSFTNGATAPSGNKFYGGHAHLFPVSELAEIADLVNLCYLEQKPDFDLLSELWMISPTQKVVRYVNKGDATKIYIKLDI